MRITTSRLLIASVVLIALANGENVRGSIEKGGEIRAQQSSFNERIRENRTKARNAQKLSKVAIDRYQSNCIFVADAKTGKQDYFLEGTKVLNARSETTVRPGAFICNNLGDTAIVSEAGTITDIARVALSDQEEFKKILQQR